MQSLSAVQAVLQAPAPHMNGAQVSATPAWQEPAPLQVAAGVKTAAVQLAAPHTVPAGAEVQVPTVPAPAQETQAPVQALLQQTPPAQKPLAHWTLLVQAAPSDAGATHPPFTQ